MRFFIFLFILAIFLSSKESLAAVSDPHKITWIRWDDPPIFIFTDPFKGEGVLDIVEKDLQATLSQYKHETIDATVPRVLKEAQVKTPMCNAGWLNTPEWEKLFYFSKPVFLIPTNGVVLKESRAREFKEFKGPYRLQNFLDKKPKWVLGVGRLYGEGIDEVLTKNNYHNNPKIFVVSSSLLAHRMLNLNRIQYTLGYPFEAQYYNELLSYKVDKLVHIPLTDNKAFVEVVVACPKSEWGKSVIKDVNKVLANRNRLETYHRGVNRWLSPSDQKRLMLQYDDFYAKNYPNL